MKLYTIQLAQWRKAQAMGYEVLDTTVKSGDKTFAPTWEIVRAVKDGVSLSGIEFTPEEDYTNRYSNLMRDSWRVNKEKWLEVCRRDTVVIGCYCSNGKFCHRYLLVSYLEKVCNLYNIPFEYAGEIT